MRNWQLQEAKARFSELVKCATANGPQNITAHGKTTVIVISKQEYDSLIAATAIHHNFAL